MESVDTRLWSVLIPLIGLSLVTCDSGVQTVRITAQDFRFTPAEIRLNAAPPIRLTIVNEGREPHEFESPILVHRVAGSTESRTSVRLAPNQRTDVMIRTIPGTYIFYCRIRGHAGMSGTIIVE